MAKGLRHVLLGGPDGSTVVDDIRRKGCAAAVAIEWSWQLSMVTLHLLLTSAVAVHPRLANTHSSGVRVKR